MTRRGVTLLELVVATTISLLVILAIGKLDVARVHLTNPIPERIDRSAEAALALAHMSRELEQADRIVPPPSPSTIQFRVPAISTNCPVAPAPGCEVVCGGCTAGNPPPCCLDNSINYRWAQYTYNGATQTIRFFDDTEPSTGGDCGLDNQFRNITGLAIQYRDESPPPPPPGGEPPVQDNNVLELQVSWIDPQSGATRTSIGEVTIRAGAYTNVMTGLAPAGVADPPAIPCS